MGASTRQLSSATIFKIAIPLVLVVGAVIAYMVLKKPKKEAEGEKDSSNDHGNNWEETPNPPAFDITAPVKPVKPVETSGWNAICYPESQSYYDIRTGNVEKDNINKTSMITFILKGIDAKGGSLTAGKTRSEINNLGIAIYKANSIEQVSQWANAIKNKRTCYVFKGNSYDSLSGNKR